MGIKGGLKGFESKNCTAEALVAEFHSQRAPTADRALPCVAIDVSVLTHRALTVHFADVVGQGTYEKICAYVWRQVDFFLKSGFNVCQCCL
jgi:hypothetical protein